MFVTTLISAPTSPTITENHAQRAAQTLGGGALTWLSEGEAVEFHHDGCADCSDLWSQLQSEGIDLVTQPVKNRRKSMLLADMDSTMIEQECIDELADLAGVGDHVKSITARAMNGELDFERALIERVALLKDLPSNIIHRVIQTRITFTGGGDVLLATMRNNGGYAALVSGGFTDFTAFVAKTLGFDEHQANELIHENDRLTGEVTMPILGREAKVVALENISRRLNIKAEDVIAVGDGANDLGMLSRAGSGVALHAKPAVGAQCKLQINHGDLTALLYIQGYAKSEFVNV